MTLSKLDFVYKCVHCIGLLELYTVLHIKTTIGGLFTVHTCGGDRPLSPHQSVSWEQLLNLNCSIILN